MIKTAVVDPKRGVAGSTLWSAQNEKVPEYLFFQLSESIEPMKHVLIAAASEHGICFPNISRVQLGSVSLDWLGILRV